MLASLNVPVAVNCCVAPFGSDTEAGVTLMDVAVTEPTVMTVFPLIEPEVAVIVVEPFATAVAKPCLPAALLIVVTPATEELHVADAVRFCVLPSV